MHACIYSVALSAVSSITEWVVFTGAERCGTIKARVEIQATPADQGIEGVNTSDRVRNEGQECISDVVI